MSAYDLRNIIFNIQGFDISTAATLYFPVTEEMEGEVVEARSCLGGTISGSDATLTVQINGVSTTNGVITIPASGSAAGQINSTRPTGNNTVKPGDYIQFLLGGESTGAEDFSITVRIQR